eukprot:5030856-Pleurochrysis_carterae.AAC.6
MGGLYVSVVPRRIPPFILWATDWVDPMQPRCRGGWCERAKPARVSRRRTSGPPTQVPDSPHPIAHLHPVSRTRPRTHAPSPDSARAPRQRRVSAVLTPDHPVLHT